MIFRYKSVVQNTLQIHTMPVVCVARLLRMHTQRRNDISTLAQSPLVTMPAVHRSSQHYAPVASGRHRSPRVQVPLRRWAWAEKMGLKIWEKVPVKFVGPGKTDAVMVDAKVGQSILQVARENNVELEAFCEGQLACSTWFLPCVSTLPMILAFLPWAW